MSNDGTVAPKERVNIVYKSETNGLQQEIELPLKVMILGEFSSEFEDTRIEEKKVIDINKENFNEVLREQKLALKTDVNNELADNKVDNRSLSLDLVFTNIKDFEPDNLIKNIPELNKLYNFRDALKALKGPLGNVPEFRRKLEGLISDQETKNKLFKELALKETNNLEIGKGD